MKQNVKFKGITAWLVASAAMVATSHAADITFSRPVSALYSSVLDVEQNDPSHTLVKAVTVGNSGSKTVVTEGGNTIKFDSDSGMILSKVDMPAATPSATSGYYNAAPQWLESGTPDTDKFEWTTVLKGTLWHTDVSDAVRPMTLHLAGLTVGQKYSIQLYTSDARFTNRAQAYWSRFSNGIFGGGTSGSFSQNPTFKVTGTFVADADYQDIFIQATDANGNADTTLSAYTLYAIPNSTVMGLMSVIGIGLLFVRRHVEV